ncbi:MAG: hypothetical protein IT378_04050, partial [Sandaracinaceae bacterium]|nr:hypothetical protein [Sandaracinaceae bacterium]
WSIDASERQRASDEVWAKIAAHRARELIGRGAFDAALALIHERKIDDEELAIIEAWGSWGRALRRVGPALHGTTADTSPLQAPIVRERTRSAELRTEGAGLLARLPPSPHGLALASWIAEVVADRIEPALQHLADYAGAVPSHAHDRVEQAIMRSTALARLIYLRRAFSIGSAAALELDHLSRVDPGRARLAPASALMLLSAAASMNDARALHWLIKSFALGSIPAVVETIDDAVREEGDPPLVFNTATLLQAVVNADDMQALASAIFPAAADFYPTLLSAETRSARGVLDASLLDALWDVAADLDLAAPAQRRLLIGALDPSLARSLEGGHTPLDQLRVDLEALNQRASEGVPLISRWIDRALEIAGGRSGSERLRAIRSSATRGAAKS